MIALVITVIVLLILAGVTIAALSGDNWILTKVKEAKEKTEQAQQNEEQTLSNMENMLGIYKFKNINKADTNPAVFSDLTKDTTQELTDQNYTDIKIGISPEAMLVQQATLMTLDLDLHFMVIREL